MKLLLLTAILFGVVLIGSAQYPYQGTAIGYNSYYGEPVMWYYNGGYTPYQGYDMAAYQNPWYTSWYAGQYYYTSGYSYYMNQNTFYNGYWR